MVRLSLCGWWLVSVAWSQEPTVSYEDLFDEQQEVTADSPLLRDLEHLQQSPLDLNRASRKELRQIPWITAGLADRIVRTRRRQGRFPNLSALLAVEGVDVIMLERIRPYMQVRPPRVTPKKRSHWRIRSRRQERDWPPPDPQSSGSANQIYQRATFLLREGLEIGLLNEKDPGEPGWLDHRIAYLDVRQQKLRLVLGNYHPEFGQGLVLWSPGGGFNGLSTISGLRKRPKGVRPYRSALEGVALRGGYLEWARGGYDLALFASNAWRDASLDEAGQVVSLANGGLHRTELERQRRAQQKERMLGGRLRWQVVENMRFGINTVHTWLNPGLAIGTSPFALTGNRNWVASIDADVTLEGINGFGEIARSRSGGVGLVAGLTTDQTHWILGTLIRHYTPDFHSSRSVAFSSGSGAPNNEQGALIAATFKPRNGMRLTLHHDQFRRFWPRAREPVPGRGEEWQVRWEQQLYPRTIRLRIQGRTRSTQVPSSATTPAGDSATRLQPRRRTTWYSNVRWSSSPRWQFEGRWQTVWSTTPDAQQRGGLWYIGGRYRYHTKGKIQVRITGFRSTGYDARLYVFEPDLPGVLGQATLYGTGRRWFVLAQDRLPGGLGWSFKFVLETSRRPEQASTLAGIQTRRQSYGMQLDWQW